MYKMLIENIICKRTKDVKPLALIFMNKIYVTKIHYCITIKIVTCNNISRKQQFDKKHYCSFVGTLFMSLQKEEEKKLWLSAHFYYITLLYLLLWHKSTHAMHYLFFHVHKSLMTLKNSTRSHQYNNVCIVRCRTGCAFRFLKQ